MKALPTILAALAIASGGANATEKTYRHYRFTPTKMLGETIIQLSEFEFLDSGDPALPIDVSGVTATNSSGNDADSPPGEPPPNALDGDVNTKWLNWAAGGPTTQGIDFDFGVATTINGYNFATANDGIGRTPVSWLFYGGVDEAPEDGVVESWELIDTRTDETIDQTLFTYQQGWVIPENFPPAINEFSTDVGIVPNGDLAFLTWDTSLADTIDISPVPGSVAASGSASVTPPDNTETTYTLTASSTVDTLTSELTIRAVTPGSASYRYVRFTPFKLRSNAAANSIQLAEFKFYNLGGEIVPAAVTNPGGDNPGSGAENPEFVIDGDFNTKWLDFTKFSPLVFDFGTPTTIDAYQFFTANDATERDPVQWYLEGSDDDSTWTLIDTVTAFDFPTEMARQVSAQSVAIPLPDTPLPLPPSIVQFIGDAPTLVAGEPLLLTWDTMESTTVTIDDGTGPVTVALSGSMQFTPAADTTYTLAASNAAATVTAEFSTTVVSPAINEIAYGDFSSAGDELGLLGASEVINAFPTIPEPGDAERLRLTDDVGGQNGTVWFRKRIDTSTGFDTTFDLHFVHLGTGIGADGMVFMLQNSPEGNGANAPGEAGLASDALNIKFDSYLNGGLEPSAAFIEVREGTFTLATADLTTFQGIRFPGITLAGADPLDLTDTVGTSLPYPVRIAYTAGSPGTLDVYFQGIRVIGDLGVDLQAANAVDSAGTGYVGFSARTGGQTETHDVTSWFLTEGPPSLPGLPTNIEILDHFFDFEFDEVTLTFSSRDNEFYRVTATEQDFGNFGTLLDSGIPGDLGRGLTTIVVPFTQTPNLFIRVEQDPE